MKVNFQICFVMIFTILCMAGCQGNRAEKMREEGVWVEKQRNFSSDESEQMAIRMTFNVKKDMTEEDMMAVLDYYKSEVFVDNPDELVGNMPCAEEDISAIYAQFYKADTYDVLKKIKYVDGESKPLTEEDEGIFKAMIRDDQMNDKEMQEEGSVKK